MERKQRTRLHRTNRSSRRKNSVLKKNMVNFLTGECMNMPKLCPDNRNRDDADSHSNFVSSHFSVSVNVSRSSFSSDNDSRSSLPPDSENVFQILRTECEKTNFCFEKIDTDTAVSCVKENMTVDGNSQSIAFLNVDHESVVSRELGDVSNNAITQKSINASDNEMVPSKTSLRANLVKLMLMRKVRKCVMTDILHILKEEFPDCGLPADATILLQTPRKADSVPMDSGKYFYYGLRSGIEDYLINECHECIII